MPVGIIAWMAAVQGLMAAAPDIIAFGGKVKGWLQDMFGSGLITKQQQDDLNQRVNDICVAALTGKLPASWQVEPDPV
jgi:hypothetical protein